MEDIIIPCENPTCDQKRIFTPRDQEFYERKGFSKPRFCRTHSAERRAAHDARGASKQDDKRSGWEREPKTYEQYGD